MSVGSQPKTDFDPLEIQDRLLGLLEPECHGEVVCHLTYKLSSFVFRTDWEELQ